MDMRRQARFDEPDDTDSRLPNELCGISFEMDTEVPFKIPGSDGRDLAISWFSVKFMVNIYGEGEYAIDDIRLEGDMYSFTGRPESKSASVRLSNYKTSMPAFVSLIEGIVNRECDQLIADKIEEKAAML